MNRRERRRARAMMRAAGRIAIDLDRVIVTRQVGNDAHTVHTPRLVDGRAVRDVERPLVRLYRHGNEWWRRRPRPQSRPNAAPNEVVWPARSTVHYRIPIGGSRAPRRAAL
jgi:hypothetical protein